MAEPTAILSFLRAEFRLERESGFALLRRVPSTSVRRFLDYFAILRPDKQDALAEGLAEVSALGFLPRPGPALAPYQAGNTEYRRYVDSLTAVPRGPWWRYEGTRMLLMTVAEMAEEPPPGFNKIELPEAVVQQIRAIEPVTAAGIRRAVKLAFAPDLSQITNLGGGNWRYEGTRDGSKVRLDIDYGSSLGDQLRYGVTVLDETLPVRCRNLSYERVMGIAGGGWDCLEGANRDASIALLQELVAYCVEMPRRLPSP